MAKREIKVKTCGISRGIREHLRKLAKRLLWA